MEIYRLWIYGIIIFLHKATGLSCWKCIAHDCDLDPEENYKASKMQCKDGDRCMKVRYRMFDNITHYDSVIRTCTNQWCTTTSDSEFLKCLATPKLYMISGCVYKTCCNDKDLCNSACTIRQSQLVALALLTIVLLCGLPLLF